MIHIPITTSLSLHSWKPNDIHKLTDLAGQKEIVFQLKDCFPSPFKLSDAVNYIDKSIQGDPPHRLAIKHDEELLGGLNLYLKNDIYKHSAEIRYWLSKDRYGQDIMRRILPIFCHYVFEHFNIQKLYACVFEEDTTSMAYFEQTGFKKEGVLKQAISKDGTLMDEHRFYMLKSEFMKPF